MSEAGSDYARLFNCQVNYLIIDKLWSYCYKSKNKLYDELDITGNQYTKIRSGNVSLSYLETKWNKKNSPLQKVGLSKEIMLGYSMLTVEGIKLKDWEDYIEIRYRDAKKKESETEDEKRHRKNKMRQFDTKLNKAFYELNDDRAPKSNIEKLSYFIKHGVASDSTIVDREMKEHYRALEQINTKQIKECDNILREQINKKLKEISYKMDIITAYKKLK